MNPLRTLLAFCLCLFLSGMMTSTALGMGKGVEPQRITKDQLFAMLGNPRVVILDVREGDSWEKSKFKMKGAVREDPEKDIKDWVERYPKDNTLVFYCS
ncbi:MAG: hypothetical protein AMJ94_00795 [Deltaproteobacteria bacterium SM23_61]|nr:MAG: hypothetical protein AMJ94_00795 [Deltaproteobacteria bacterium SM23_61]